MTIMDMNRGRYRLAVIFTGSDEFRGGEGGACGSRSKKDESWEMGVAGTWVVDVDTTGPGLIGGWCLESELVEEGGEGWVWELTLTTDSLGLPAGDTQSEGLVLSVLSAGLVSNVAN